MKNFFLHNREAALALIVAALALLIGLRAPVFLTPSNLLDVLTDSSILAILVMGQMVVLLTKGIDLSVASNLALNDVVVDKGAIGRMIEFELFIDGEFIYHLRADGLIVSTPTGSTAYALSAGGPMLHPSIPAWVMVPIAPHNLSNRPIVLSDAQEVTIEVVGGRGDASANFDMQSLKSLQHGDRILVTRADHSVHFLHPKGWNYFDTLRKKLGWNEGGV